MGYYMRYIVTDDRPLSLGDVEAGLRSVDPGYAIGDGDLRYGGELYGEVEIMGYEVHIERQDRSPISLDEWCAAVAASGGLRLATEEAFARNPATGEKIRIPCNQGDVEVYFPEQGAWIPYLWYSPERISFRPPDDFLDPQSQFRRALVTIAGQLNAQVVGDDGEVYT